MKSEHLPKPKRPAFLGPGTIIALVAAVAIVASGQLKERQATDPNAGRVMFEADAGGVMRQVQAPTIVPGTPPKLWKPEVGLLLQHTSELRLDSRQKNRIETLNADWLREKATLEAAIHGTVSEADGKMKDAQAYHSASASQVTASLGDYSQLSRQYNNRREFYWSRALETLSESQNQIWSRMPLRDGRVTQR